MKHRISEVGARMLKYQEQLARDYGYKPIPCTFFCDVRAEFQKALPKWCNVSGDTISLETADGTVITNGYNRIVIGDYGAFVEFSRVQACMRRLEIKEGQVYRVENPRYGNTAKGIIACVRSFVTCTVSWLTSVKWSITFSQTNCLPTVTNSSLKI